MRNFFSMSGLCTVSKPCSNQLGGKSSPTASSAVASPGLSGLYYTLLYILLGEGNGNPLQHSCLESHGRRSLIGYNPWGRRVGHD